MDINKLNDRQLKNAKPGEKDYRLSDGSGLYLVVKSNGGKLWRWSYEFNGREKLLSCGPYPSVSLAQARELHEEARALKRSGIDPAAAKQAKKHEEEESKRESSMPTFAALTEEWLKTWSKKKSARYVATVKTRLERDILPVIGETPIDQLKTASLVKVVSGIQDDRDAEDLARRALQKMKQILRFAVAKGYIESSPIADTRPSDFRLGSHCNIARSGEEGYHCRRLRRLMASRARWSAKSFVKPKTQLAMKGEHNPLRKLLKIRSRNLRFEVVTNVYLNYSRRESKLLFWINMMACETTV